MLPEHPSIELALELNSSTVLASILRSVQAIVLTLGSDGRVKQANRACYDITGFKPEELIGRSLYSALLIPEEIGFVKRAFDGLKRGEPSAEFESFILDKHGERRRIRWSGASLSDDPATDDSIVLTGLDVTAEREALERLAQAEREVRETKKILNDLNERFIQQHGMPAVEIPLETKPKPAKSGRERRIHPRRDFSFVQFFAPMNGDRLPDRESFRAVACHDVSAGGFSFVAQHPPDFQKLVVALGHGSTTIYMAARIAHMTPMMHNGRSMYQIGCSYIGRANYD